MILNCHHAEMIIDHYNDHHDDGEHHDHDPHHDDDQDGGVQCDIGLVATTCDS